MKAETCLQVEGKEIYWNLVEGEDEMSGNYFEDSQLEST